MAAGARCAWVLRARSARSGAAGGTAAGSEPVSREREDRHRCTRSRPEEAPCLGHKNEKAFEMSVKLWL